MSKETNVLTPDYLAEQDCVTNNNLYELANNFISRCCKASIRSEFPGEYMNKSLGYIKNDKTAIGKKAWKLLNDSRFRK
ncbi:MAG: hypothetical protein Fur006_60810 [Coleofasciculaceae cyanobacterium]